TSYTERFWNTATSKTVNLVKQIHAIVDGKVVVISKSSVRSDFLFNDEDAPEGEGSAIPPEPQPTPSTSQPNISEPQTAPFQAVTHLIVSHEPKTEAHIEQILPTPSTYQRKHRKTHKHRRTKKVTKLPQTSVLLDLGADKTQAPRNHIGGADAQTRFETASKKSRDPPLLEVNTSRSGEDRMEHPDDFTDFVPPTPHDSPLSGDNTPKSNEGRPNLLELMNTCTQLSNRVLAWEEAKTTQAKVISILKLRVRRLEKKRNARTLQPMKRRLFKGRVETSTDKSLGKDASKQGRNNDKTEELNLTDEVDTEVIIEGKGSGEKILHCSDFDKLRSEKAKEKGVAFRDVEEPPRLTRSTTTLQPLPTINPKDKGKGVLVKEEPETLEKVKRKDQGLVQIESDAYLAQRIYEEELVELDRAPKEKQKQEEATIRANGDWRMLPMDNRIPYV
nr:hypothetical protein [Tanacetum cinerariifolium]